MRALDGSALAALLEGDPAVRTVLRGLRGHEVGTTEISFAELSCQIEVGPPRARAHRRMILDRLRRKLTVLPIDGRAVAEAARRAAASPRRPDLLRLLEWGALEANGCEVLHTRAPPRTVPGGSWRFKVVRLVSSKMQ